MGLSFFKNLCVSLKLSIFFGYFFCILLSSNSFSDFIPYDTTYSSFTEQDSVTDKKLNRYKRSLSDTTFNPNSIISTEKTEINTEYINNNQIESIEQSMIEDLDQMDNEIYSAYSYKNLMDNQMSVPSTETNPENFFPAYNQQHTKTKGVQFQQVISSFTIDNQISQSNMQELKTFVDIERVNTSQDASFDNVVRKMNDSGISRVLILDSINSVYFEPNLTSPYQNITPVNKNNKRQSMIKNEQDTQKTEIFGSI